MKTWLGVSYISIFIARILFYMFEGYNRKIMKFAAISILFIHAPFHLVWTILGTKWYSSMLKSEITCVLNFFFV